MFVAEGVKNTATSPKRNGAADEGGESSVTPRKRRQPVMGVEADGNDRSGATGLHCYPRYGF